MVKRCPTCNKSFTDPNLSFCVDDGTPLVSTETPEEEVTLVMPSPADKDDGTSDFSARAERGAPAYQAPGSYLPPGSQGQNKPRNWPWMLGILTIAFIVFAGFGIAAVVLIPRLLRASSNSNSGNPNANIERPANSNSNLSERNSNTTNGNENENANSVVDDTTPAPTDRETVLADLKNLEDEWTIANINADKKKLNHILADDYVGVTEGRAQGKAEYLKTIERDTAIQHWKFEDLKVSLNGDRASLTGIIRLDVKDQNGQDQQIAYQFTDKFVWRDGRWQAIGSEVNPLKELPGVTS